MVAHSTFPTRSRCRILRIPALKSWTLTRRFVAWSQMLIHQPLKLLIVRTILFRPGG